MNGIIVWTLSILCSQDQYTAFYWINMYLTLRLKKFVLIWICNRSLLLDTYQTICFLFWQNWLWHHLINLKKATICKKAFSRLLVYCWTYYFYQCISSWEVSLNLASTHLLMLYCQILILNMLTFILAQFAWSTNFLHEFLLSSEKY